MPCPNDKELFPREWGIIAASPLFPRNIAGWTTCCPWDDLQKWLRRHNMICLQEAWIVAIDSDKIILPGCKAYKLAGKGFLTFFLIWP